MFCFSNGQVDRQIEHLFARQRQLQSQKERLSRLVEVDQRAPRRDWQGQFDWDDAVARALKDVFGIQTFRYRTGSILSSGTVDTVRRSGQAQRILA